MNIPVSKEAAAGAAGYSKFALYFYDLYVLMFEMQFVFKCPTHKILDFYNRHISDRHLDVGVGTGYFLDKCNFPVDNPTVYLMDLNLNSLQKTADRIKRYNPVAHHWNVFEPIQYRLLAALLFLPAILNFVKEGHVIMPLSGFWVLMMSITGLLRLRWENRGAL